MRAGWRARQGAHAANVARWVRAIANEVPLLARFADDPAMVSSVKASAKRARVRLAQWGLDAAGKDVSA